MALSAPYNRHVAKVRGLAERVLADLYDEKSWYPEIKLDPFLEELATVEEPGGAVQDIVFPKAALWYLSDKIVGDGLRLNSNQRVDARFKEDFDNAVKRFTKQYRFQYEILEPRGDDEPELQVGPISDEVYERWFEQMKMGTPFRTFVERTHRKYKAAESPAKPPQEPLEVTIGGGPSRPQYLPPNSKRRKAAQEIPGDELNTWAANQIPEVAEIANFVTKNAAWHDDTRNHFRLYEPIQFLKRAITPERCHLLRMPRKGSGDGLSFCNPLDDKTADWNGDLIKWATSNGLFNVEYTQISAWTSDPLTHKEGMGFANARHRKDLEDLTRQQHTRVLDKSMHYPMRLAELGIYPGGKGTYNVIWFFVPDAPEQENQVVADLFRKADLKLTEGAVRCPLKNRKAHGLRRDEALRNAWNSLCGAKYNFGPGIAAIAHSYHRESDVFSAIMLTERLHETLGHRINGMRPLVGPTAPSYKSITIYLKKLQNTIFQMSRNRILFIDGKPHNFMDNQNKINLFVATQEFVPSNVDVLAVDLDYTGARRLTDFENCPDIENDNSVNFVWAYNMLYVGCWLRFEGVSYEKILSQVWYDQSVKDAIAGMIRLNAYPQRTRVWEFIEASGWHEQNFSPLSKTNANVVPPSDLHDMESVGKSAAYYAQYYFLNEKLRTMQTEMMSDMENYARRRAYDVFATNYEERQLPMVLFMLHVYEHVTKLKSSVVFMMRNYMDMSDVALKSKFNNVIVPRGEITKMLQSWQFVGQGTKEQYVTRMLGKLQFV